MAKKHRDEIDALVDELTKHRPADEVLRDSGLLRELKKRAAFPTDDSVRKVLYLAIIRASQRWTMPIRDWPSALNYFNLTFPGRLPINP